MFHSHSLICLFRFISCCCFCVLSSLLPSSMCAHFAFTVVFCYRFFQKICKKIIKELCVCASHKCFYILYFFSISIELFHYMHTLFVVVVVFVIVCFVYFHANTFYILSLLVFWSESSFQNTRSHGARFHLKNQRNMPLAIDERNEKHCQSNCTNVHKTPHSMTATSIAHISKSHTLACRYTQFNGFI